VYKNTLATFKSQIQQLENPMPAVVISVEAARLANAILLNYLTSEVALKEREIRSPDRNIPIDNNCMNEALYFRIPEVSVDFEDEGDESDEHDASSTASRGQWATTDLRRSPLETSDVDGYEGKDGDDADADKEEEPSQADDGSTHNVEE
jgi:hypothetical protein